MMKEQINLYMYKSDEISDKYAVGAVYGDFIIIDNHIATNSNTNTRRVRVKCMKCGREQNVYVNSLLKRINTHENICSKIIFENKELPPSIESRFYKIWSSMRNRTTDIKNKDYCGRGINSDYFKNFITFYENMYDSYLFHVAIYGDKNTTIDRIDVNGNYTPDNCKWSTISEQNNNKTNAIHFKAIDPNGVEYESSTLAIFCREHNLNPGTIRDSISKGNGITKNLKSNWIFIRK